eukprot:g2851.t1
MTIRTRKMNERTKNGSRSGKSSNDCIDNDGKEGGTGNGETSRTRRTTPARRRRKKRDPTPSSSKKRKDKRGEISTNEEKHAPRGVKNVGAEYEGGQKGGRKKKRVAVVGSGIAGLTATWLIGQEHEVTLFERAERLGMDAAGYDLPEGRRVDLPPRACSRTYYPNLTALYDAAGIALAPFSWAFCYMDAADPSGKPYFRVDGGSTTKRSKTVCGFRLPSMNGLSGWLRLLRPSNVVMFLDAVRFHVAIRKDVERPQDWEVKTFGVYLSQGGYSDAFVNRGLLPMLSMVCTCSYENVLNYPAAVIMRYLAVSSSHEQFRTKNGTQNAARTLAAAAEHVRLSVRVNRVFNDQQSGKPVVEYFAPSSSSSLTTEDFDVVIVAAPANVASKLLGSHSKTLCEALEKFDHETSRVLLHRDPVVMPRDRDDWAAMAMLCDSCEDSTSSSSSGGRVMFTMYASHEDVLALDESEHGPVFMTWNPFPSLLSQILAKSDSGHGIKRQSSYPGVAVNGQEDDKILSQVVFERPLMTVACKDAVETVWREQGEGHIYVVGAYTLFDVPLQENGVASAIAVTSRLGVRVPFRPARKARLRGSRTEDAEAKAPGRRALRIGDALCAIVSFVAALSFVSSNPPWAHVPSSSAALREDKLDFADVVVSGFSALTVGIDAGGSIRVAAYFALLLVAIAAAVANYPWQRVLRESPLHVVPVACSAVALIVTWRLILAFFCEFVDRHAGAMDSAPNMFVEAYIMVSDDPVGWLWSSQLLLWVAPAIVFIYVESRRLGVTWYVALSWVTSSFFGAVSLGCPIAMSHLDLLANEPGRRPIGKLRAFEVLALAVCALLAIVSVHVMPTFLASDRKSYVVALVVVHVVLVVPFAIRGMVVGRVRSGPGTAARTDTLLPSLSLSLRHPWSRFGAFFLYVAMAIGCSIVHGANVEVAMQGDTDSSRSRLDFVRSAVFSDLAWRNSCQSSIDYDVVFTSLTTAALVVSNLVKFSGSSIVLSIFLLATAWGTACFIVPFFSLATYFSTFLAIREVGAWAVR